MAKLGTVRTQGRAAALLAAFALVVQIFVPSGFMAARTGDGGSAIVICTGQGPLLVRGADHSKPFKSQQRDGGHFCAFAGHGTTVTAPMAWLPRSERIDLVAPQAILAVDLQPGRGLAAPPPPSHGPPALSI